MTYKEAQTKIQELLPSIKGKIFKDTAIKKEVKVDDLIAKTKDENNPDNWEVYVVTDKKRDSDGMDYYMEVEYETFMKNCEEQN